MMATRSQSVSASSMWCVVSTTVWPSALMARSRSHRFRLACESSAPVGLVQEQHFRPVHERAGDGQPLRLPAGQLLRAGGRTAGHAHHFEHVVGPSRRDAVECGKCAQLLTGSEMLEERRRLELDADPGQQRGVTRPRRHVQHANLAAVRLAQALDDLKCGGLARSVGPEDAEELALTNLERHPVDRVQVSVGLPEIPYRNRYWHTLNVAIQPGSGTLRVSELGGHVIHMVRHRRLIHQALRYVPL